MPRGGRRRRRRGRPGAESKPKHVQDGGQSLENGPRRGRRGGIDAAQALRAMSIPRPAQAQTLPADGTVLEELIESMQGEYGTPSTPQEYRLLIKVATKEQIAADERVAQPTLREPVPARSRRRNRRRGRRGRLGSIDPSQTSEESGGSEDIH